jgi:hypothetical protein
LALGKNGVHRALPDAIPRRTADLESSVQPDRILPGRAARLGDLLIGVLLGVEPPRRGYQVKIPGAVLHLGGSCCRGS